MYVYTYLILIPSNLSPNCDPERVKPPRKEGTLFCLRRGKISKVALTPSYSTSSNLFLVNYVAHPSIIRSIFVSFFCCFLQVCGGRFVGDAADGASAG